MASAWPGQSVRYDGRCPGLSFITVSFGLPGWLGASLSQTGWRSCCFKIETQLCSNQHLVSRVQQSVLIEIIKVLFLKSLVAEHKQTLSRPLLIQSTGEGQDGVEANRDWVVHCGTSTVGRFSERHRSDCYRVIPGHKGTSSTFWRNQVFHATAHGQPRLVAIGP